MQLPIQAVVQLLHEAAFATLATHSVKVPGFPFGSVVPFAPDSTHRPVMLMSSLAEHTKNLEADPRASLLVFRADGEDVQSGARLTLMGGVSRYEPDAGQRARYFRYQPEGPGHYALGDFAFYRMVPVQMRLVAGFGRMGWIDADSLARAATLDESEELRLVELAGADRPEGVTVLGVDRYGVDLRVDGARRRLSLPEPVESAAALARAVVDSMRAFAESRSQE